MSTLNIQPPRVPLVDPDTGIITREWYRFITDSFARQGGYTAPTNTDLDLAMPEDSGVAELEMYVRGLDNEFSQLPPNTGMAFDEIGQAPLQQAFENVEFLQTQVRDMAEQIAVLMAQIDELKQGTML
jgi:hypothetical protein